MRTLPTRPPARRRPAARHTVAAAVVLLACALPGPAAVADAEQDAAGAAASAQQAQGRAASAALQVTVLTEAYVAAAARSRAGLSALAAAYSQAARTQASAQTAQGALVRARVERSRRVRALYVMGGSSTLAASVLAADSPEDALWRTGTVQHVLTGLVRRSQQDVRDGQQEVGATRAQQRVADADLTAQVAALDRLETDAESAQAALTQAHALLESLDEQARTAEVAAAAAQALADAEAQTRAAQRAASATVTAVGIPDEFAQAYHDFAGTCPGLRWTLLAGVGQVESGHGRNNGPSSAGALGPMQFMPATFAAYGVDGDGDGALDVADPQDAVASAANYLCDSGIDGTPDGDRTALLAYNHAQWYVDLVLDAEASITAASITAGQITAGQAAPGP